MYENGFLSPQGNFYECDGYFHMTTAEKICDSIGAEYKNGFLAEQKLFHLGWIELKTYDALAMFSRHRPMTKQQHDWLINNYHHFHSDKQRAVDYLLDVGW